MSNALKTKQLDREWEEKGWCSGGPGEDGVEKSQRMLIHIYGFVKAKVRHGAEFLAAEKEARCAR